MAVLPLLANLVFADEQNTDSSRSQNQLSGSLPNMGNTDELDRVLSREVSDSFVFGQQNLSDSLQAQDKRVIHNAEPESNNSPPASLTATNAVLKTVTQASVDRDANSTISVDNTQSQLAPDAWSPVFETNAAHANSVWQHIIQSDRLPLADHERVKFYLDQYQRESLWISKILHRGSPFLAHLVASLDQRFLPVELALLPAIESGFKTTAKSRGNAAGLWQIVPITAKEIGVTTTAAIDYLSYLNAEFNGDWELTLAAYNAGPGRVRAAMKKNKNAGLPTDFWSLDLPRETLNYVPKLVALVSMIKMTDHGGLNVPELPMEPAFESIDVGFRVSLDRAAKIAEIDLDLLRSLNAGLIHGVTAPQGPHHLLIPVGSGDRFQQAFSSVDRNSAFSAPFTHNVSSGDTISSIALQYGLSQQALLSMNALDDTKIRIGQKLAVKDSSQLSESVVKYVVSIGDTLSEIAHKFSVNVTDITLSTGEVLNSNVIHPGDTLNINVSTPSSG